MFNATLASKGQAKKFAQFVSSLRHFNSNVCFEFLEDHINIRTNDEDNVCMINCTYNAYLFDSYECNNNFLFGVSTDALEKALLSVRTNKMTLRLEISDAEPQYLVVYINGVKSYRCKNTQKEPYDLEVPDPDERNTVRASGVQPELLHNMVKQMSFYEFLQIRRNATFEFDPKIQVTANKTDMTFSMTCPDTKDSITFLHKFDRPKTALTDTFKGFYMVKEIAKVIRFCTLNEKEVIIECINIEGKPQPLRISFFNDHYECHTLIAPLEL